MWNALHLSHLSSTRTLWELASWQLIEDYWLLRYPWEDDSNEATHLDTLKHSGVFLREVFGGEARITKLSDFFAALAHQHVFVTVLSYGITREIVAALVGAGITLGPHVQIYGQPTGLNRGDNELWSSNGSFSLVPLIADKISRMAKLLSEQNCSSSSSFSRAFFIDDDAALETEASARMTVRTVLTMSESSDDNVPQWTLDRTGMTDDQMNYIVKLFSASKC